MPEPESQSTLPAFQNRALLDKALTHRSALNEKGAQSTESNERLEFLGDAVLELITTDFLYRTFPNESEGVLTAYRSALVKTASLAAVAKDLELGEALHMSRGEESSGGRNNDSILADSFEAILGALYLDRGLAAVEQFLSTHLFKNMGDILSEKRYKDPKSELQERVQAQSLPAPIYEVVSEIGPDHDKKFTVSVHIDGVLTATGVGKSKQQAQQEAAKKALKHYQA